MGEVRALGLQPDAASFTTTLTACARAGQGPAALALLEGLQSLLLILFYLLLLLLVLLLVLFLLVLLIFLVLLVLIVLLVLFVLLLLLLLPPSSLRFNCAIKACGACGQWEAALQLLDELEAHGLQPRRDTFNAALSACEKGRNKILSVQQQQQQQ